MSWRACLRFLGDLAISAAISFALSAGWWAFLDSLGRGGAFMFMFAPLLLLALPALVYAPFAIVALYGLIRLRPGLVAGPLVLAVVAYANSASDLAKRETAIAVAIPAVQAPLMPDHRVLALTNRSSSTQCEAACIRILATTDHVIALTISEIRRWEIYTPASGAICSAAENAVLAIEFLEQGYPDKCALKTTAADLAEGLLLRKFVVDQYHHAPGMPEGFYGTVYELHERISGQDRLLARRVVGGLNPAGPHSLMAFAKRSPPIDSGPPLDERQFLATATKIAPAALFDKAQPFPFDQVLDGIESYFDRKEVVSQTRLRSIEDFAGYTWWVVAGSGVRSHEADLRKHVVRLLTSSDEPRLEAVINTIGQMPVDQRIFADDRLLDLTFDPRAGISSRAVGVLTNRFRDGRFPPSDELRARAKSHLDDTGLTPEQRQLLVRISQF